MVVVVAGTDVVCGTGDDVGCGTEDDVRFGADVFVFDAGTDVGGTGDDVRFCCAVRLCCEV